MTYPAANLVDMTVDPDGNAYRSGFRAAWSVEPERPPNRESLAYRVGLRHGTATAMVPSWMFWRDER